MNITEVSTPVLKEFIKNKKGWLIDARPSEAYHGWTLQNEKKGGHIKGAKSLPLKWTKYMDWIEIVRSKGIFEEHEIILYSYQKEEALQLAKVFQKAGYTQLSIYPHFISEWIEEDLPMNSLARYKNLVYPEWVNALINDNKPPHYDHKKYVICHSHYRNRAAYLSGHIPGAIDLDTLALEAPETWNRRSPEEIKKALEAHGITADTTVVLYGKFMDPDNADDFPGSAAGHIGAIRNAMIMMYAGVKDVRVLNGGFRSWTDAGFEVSKEDVPKQAVEDFGLKIPANPQLIVDIPKAREMIKAEDADLVCTRSWLEYIGEVSGYNYIEKKGRIPGAVFVNCGSDAYHMENYRNLDHTVREFQETMAIWQSFGLSPDKHLAFLLWHRMARKRSFL